MKPVSKDQRFARAAAREVRWAEHDARLATKILLQMNLRAAKERRS